MTMEACVIPGVVLVVDVTVASYRPSPRPRACIFSVGGDLIQHSTTAAFPAGHDPSNAVFIQVPPIRVKNDRVLIIRSQVSPNQQHLDKEYPHYHQHRPHAPMVHASVRSAPAR